MQRDDEERFEILRELKRCLTSVLEVTSSKELAREYVLGDDEQCVQDLLVWTERALWHGLKRFHLEEPVTLWTVVQAHLRPPPEDAEAVDKVLRLVLRKAHTDTGRSRAWVRLALNAGVLGTSLACLDAGAHVFYEPLSLWQSTEMRSIAVSLLQSLKGLKFELGVDGKAFDTDPEPSRRPHLLGVAHLANAQRPRRTFSKKASQAAIDRRSQLARARKEIDAMRSKASAVPAPKDSFGWLKKTFDTLSHAMAAATDPPPPPQRPPPPPPSLIGTPLSVLVKDPRTCDAALTDWQLGVPDAISAALALIDLDETCDPFDAARARDEDDPAFVKDVAAMLARLSTHHRSSPEPPPQASSADARPPSSTAVAVLKLVLRQLPVPLFPYDQYDALLECSRIGDPLARARNVKLLIDSLPAEHRPTLALLMDVAGRACDDGRTSPHVFAAAIAPCIVRPLPGMSGGLGRAQDAAEVVSIMVEQRAEIMRNVVRDLQERQARLDAKLARLRAVHEAMSKPVDAARDAALLERLWRALGPRDNDHNDDDDDDYEAFPGAVAAAWMQRGCRGASVVDDLRGCGLASLQHLVDVCESQPARTMRAAARRFGGGVAPGTFPFVMGCAQACRSALCTLGQPPEAQFVARKIAELPSWVLLDDETASAQVCGLVVADLLAAWDAQNATSMDFTRLLRETIVRLETALDDAQPESMADLRAALGAGSAAAQSGNHNAYAAIGQAVTPPPPPSNPTSPALDGPPPPPPTGPPLPAKTAVKDDDDFLPRLLSPSECIAADDVLPLEAALPLEYRGYDWQLCFSTTAHGFNRDELFERCRKHTATLLFIRDGAHVFGGFATEPWVPHHDKHFGTGQCFVFTFAYGGKLEAWHWTKQNNLFMLASDDSLAMGGGGSGFGLYVDGLDLGAGMTSKCLTYGNDKPLVPGEDNGEDAVDFKCQVIEVWYFEPKAHARR